MLSFINKIFKSPFTHDPNSFRLMITSSPKNKNLVAFKYSANGGRNWKYIYHAQQDGHRYIWEPFTIKSISYAYSVRMSNKFSSYQRILDFEKEEKEKYDNWNNSQSKKKTLKKILNKIQHD
jgi:hypothetical protein